MTAIQTRSARVSSRGDIALIAAMLLPSFALLTAFVLIPLGLGVRLSGFDWDGVSASMTPVGLGNYIAIWSDSRFIQSLGRTAIWAVLHFALAVGGALILAALINEVVWARVRTVFRSLAFLPHVLSLSVVGVVWAQVYHPQVGLLNATLDLIGLDSLARSWLGETQLALGAVAVASAWQAFSFYLVIFLAGMQTVDPSLYEAARLDGAGSWGRFRHVTLPALYNTMSLVIVIAFANAMKGFGTVWSMTGGGPVNSTELASVYIWRTAFQGGEVGLASAAGLTVAVLIVLGVSLLTAWRDRAAERR